MRICLISTEIFAWGKHGGFGRATRTIGRELAKRGHEVSAVVPRRAEQRPVEMLDGIKVYGFSPTNPLTATACLKAADAQVYHSCEPSFPTWLAMRAMPQAKHMVTFRDPRDLHDWWMEFELPSLSRLQVVHNFLFEHNFLTNRCIKRMDAVFSIARYLTPKIKRMYGLEHEPIFLPTPVALPERVDKAARPTVFYVARLDRRKRPRLFLDLARQFPEVRFLAMGKSRDLAFDAELRRDYADVPNLELTGFLDQFGGMSHAEVLNQSWIMVNTATREALPNAFLESAANACAILSFLDPDGFASRFGANPKEGELAQSLRWLLEEDRWRERGELGRRHMAEVFELDRAMDRHEVIYERLVKGGDRSPEPAELERLIGVPSGTPSS